MVEEIEREVLYEHLFDLIQVRNAHCPSVWVEGQGGGRAYFTRALPEGLVKEFGAVVAELMQLSEATAAGRQWIIEESVEAFRAFLQEEVMESVGYPGRNGWGLWNAGASAARAEARLFHRAVVKTCLSMIREMGFSPPIYFRGVRPGDALTALAAAVAAGGLEGGISPETREKARELESWSAQLIAKYGYGVASYHAELTRLGRFLRAEQG